MLVSSVPTAELYSIGAAAKASGISTDSIRIWERRYGRPSPVRLESGHRRYTAEQVHWLRRVGEALAVGMRAGVVVPLSSEELDDLLGRGQAGPPTLEVRSFLRAVRRLDRDHLERSLRQFYQTHGLLDFYDRCLAPLMKAVGEAWADGELEIRHEHFFSEVCEDVLRSLRLASGHGQGCTRLLLTAFAEEKHSLGLQMAGLICAVHNRGPLILGSSTPTAEIATAAGELAVDGVVLSVSRWTGGSDTDRELKALREMIDPSIPIVAGGDGARGPRRGVSGVVYIDRWSDFIDWLASLDAVEAHEQGDD